MRKLPSYRLRNARQRRAKRLQTVAAYAAVIIASPIVAVVLGLALGQAFAI